jgi:hypothetical protein
MTDRNPDIYCSICHGYLYSLSASNYTIEELTKRECCDNPKCQKKFTLLLLKEQKQNEQDY